MQFYLRRDGLCVLTKANMVPGASFVYAVLGLIAGITLLERALG